ncbi:unnamed protein product [Calicophoron daubneyi]|uniref:N-terminal methionine N(alpha)-acetyltransferase NatE n=1 Tax=Calicophoron daubneyi TaxID=300641 RepID=A0AAV2T6C8_CALDB
MATVVENGNVLPPIKQTKKEKKSYRIELGQLTPHNIKQFRLINQVVFPISYTEKFYTDMLKNNNMCRLAYFNDIVVGAVSYRIEKVGAGGPDSTTDGPPANNALIKKCYIMTLGCLAPYRGLGIGRVMLRHVVRFCQKHEDIKSIYLHVHVENSGAVAFYKKFGFEITGEVEGYYRCVQPQSAFVLEKYLSPADAVDSCSDSD